jgi:hypothetical protein
MCEHNSCIVHISGAAYKKVCVNIIVASSIFPAPRIRKCVNIMVAASIFPDPPARPTDKSVCSFMCCIGGKTEGQELLNLLIRSRREKGADEEVRNLEKIF